MDIALYFRISSLWFPNYLINDFRLLVVNAVWLNSGVVHLCLRSILKHFVIKVSFLVVINATLNFFQLFPVISLSRQYKI